MNHRPNRLASILVVQLYAALHHVYPKCAFAGDSYSPGVGHVDRAIWVRVTATCHLPLGQEAQYRLKPSSLDNKLRTTSTRERTSSTRGVPCHNDVSYMGLCQPRPFPKIDWMGRFFHLFLRTGSTEREWPDA